MKKIFSERVLAVFLVFIAFVFSWYLYKEGKISFLPQKDRPVRNQNLTAEIPYSKSEYKLSYENYPLDDIAEIAFFEDTEKWTGDGEFDYSSMVDGKSSLFLSSNNSYKAVATYKINKQLLLDGYRNLKMFVNLKNTNADIESFVIKITNYRNENIFYTVRQLNQGWNLVIIELDKFSNSNKPNSGVNNNNFGQIKEVSYELVSLPKSTVSVNLDSLWLERNENYQNDWNFGDYKYFAIKKDNERTLPYVIGLSGTVATLKEIGSSDDFSFIVKFTPLGNGSYGLFLRGDYHTSYGYYFLVDGVESNGWKINKYGSFNGETKTKELARGEISNFKMEKNKDYYLKGELKKNNLVFFISIDGTQYTKLGEVTDNSFISGGVGIVTQGASFTVDEITFFK